MENKALQALGLCMRAGKLISGEGSVIDAIRSGEAKLVILAVDASDNTAKKVTDKCAYYQVPYYQCFQRDQIGASLGKGERVSVAITDRGFANWIKKCLGNTVEVKELGQSEQ